MSSVQEHQFNQPQGSPPAGAGGATADNEGPIARNFDATWPNLQHADASVESLDRRDGEALSDPATRRRADDLSASRGELSALIDDLAAMLANSEPGGVDLRSRLEQRLAAARRGQTAGQSGSSSMPAGASRVLGAMTSTVRASRDALAARPFAGVAGVAIVALLLGYALAPRRP